MSDASRVKLAYAKEHAYGASPTKVDVSNATITAKPTDTGITFSANVADQSIEDSDNNFVIAGFVAGQQVTITGFTEGGNNITAQPILTVAAGKLTFAAGTGIVDEVVGDNVLIVSPQNVYTDSGGGFLTDLFVADMEVRVAGFTTSGNNGDVEISSVTADYMVVTGLTLTAELEGDTVTMKTPIFQELRHTGESLTQETDSVDSAEIRDDRQINDVVRTNIRAAGDLNFELSYDAFDEFLVAALHSAGWSTEVEDTQITFSMAAVDSSINDSGNGFVTVGFVANQWIRVVGFAGDTTMNDYYKIVSVAAGKMVLEGGPTIVDDAAGESVTITMGPQILNGTTASSFSIEKTYADLTTTLTLLQGLMPNQLSMEVPAEGIITGTFSFIGKDEDTLAATAATVEDIATTKEVMNAIDDVKRVLEGLVEIDVTTFGFTLVNNLRPRSEVGTLGAAGVGAGSIGITGTLSAYFESKTLLDKYHDWDETNLALVMEDKAGNGIVIEFPRVHITGSPVVAAGKDEDVVAEMTWSAFRETTEGITVRIAKFDV